MKLYVDKFVSGSGSVIKLAVGAKGAVYKDYTAYMTYDQGSIKRSGGEQGSFLYFISFLNTYPISFVVYSLIAYGIVILWLGFRVRRQMKKRLCIKIMDDIIDFRRNVKKDPDYNLPHLNVYIYKLEVYMPRGWKLRALGGIAKITPRQR